MPKNTPEDIIRRVLDLQEIDSFEWADAPVLFTFPIDFAKTYVSWVIPLPVHGGDGKVIGFASLGTPAIFPRSGPTFADLFLIRDTPERLDLQMNTRPMYLVADNVTRIYGGDAALLREIRIESLKIASSIDGIIGAGIEAIR